MDDKTLIYKLNRELNALRRACCVMPIPTRGTFRKTLEKDDPVAAEALVTALQGVQTLIRPLMPGDPAFVGHLRTWVTRHGTKVNFGILNGSCGVPVIQYEDDKVRIACGVSDLGLEVERMENHNPVLCVWEDGRIIRTHGEFSYIEEHLAMLLGV